MKSVILSSFVLCNVVGCAGLLPPANGVGAPQATSAAPRPIMKPLAEAVPAALPEASKPASMPAYVGPQAALELATTKEQATALCSSEEKFRKVLAETEESTANEEVNQFAEVLARHVTDKPGWERYLSSRGRTKGVLRDYLIVCAVGLDAPSPIARNFVKFWLEKQPPADTKNIKPEEGWKRILPLWLDPSNQEAAKGLCPIVETKDTKGLPWLGCTGEMILKRDRELKIETSPWKMDDIIRNVTEPMLDADGYRYVRLKNVLEEDRENHVNAEKKYNGVKIRTVGEVGTIFGGKLGQVSVFQPGSGGGSMMCTVGPKGEEELTKLKRGAPIAVRGKAEFGGRGLKDCQIVH